MRPFDSNPSPRRARSWAGLLALCMSLWAWNVHAQAPAMLTYQGQLTEASGQPASGPLEMRFAIHDQATGGDELWSETLPELEPDAQGRVHAELGGLTPLQGVFAQAEPLWLSVQVQGEDLEPRLKLASVPWAMRAGHARRADQLGGKTLAQIEAKHQTELGAQRARITELEAQLEALTARVDTHEARLEMLTGRLARTAQAEVVRGLSARVADSEHAMGQLEVNVADTTQRLEGLETLTQELERTQIHGQPALVLTGANFHVRSGAGATDAAPNGRGNLVVGYDEPASSGTARKTGSHNLIVGKSHEYTSYTGVVFGRSNRVSAPFGAALGGQFNSASASGSVVVSGRWNQATGPLSAVLGGDRNRASGGFSTASGGYDNEASGQNAVVCGGAANVASGDFSVVAGGSQGSSSGRFSSVQGGRHGAASAEYSAVSGGLHTTVTLPHQHAP